MSELSKLVDQLESLLGLYDLNTPSFDEVVERLRKLASTAPQPSGQDILSAAREAFGYEGGLQTINAHDLQSLAEVLNAAPPPAVVGASSENKNDLEESTEYKHLALIWNNFKKLVNAQDMPKQGVTFEMVQAARRILKLERHGESK